MFFCFSLTKSLHLISLASWASFCLLAPFLRWRRGVFGGVSGVAAEGATYGRVSKRDCLLVDDRVAGGIAAEQMEESNVGELNGERERERLEKESHGIGLFKALARDRELKFELIAN
jgi:hypothetical protein